MKIKKAYNSYASAVDTQNDVPKWHSAHDDVRNFREYFSADIKVSKFRLHGCNMYSGADLEEGGVLGGSGPFPSLEKSNVLNKCTL